MAKMTSGLMILRKMKAKEDNIKAYMKDKADSWYECKALMFKWSAQELYETRQLEYDIVIKL